MKVIVLIFVLAICQVSCGPKTGNYHCGSSLEVTSACKDACAKNQDKEKPNPCCFAGGGMSRRKDVDTGPGAYCFCCPKSCAQSEPDDCKMVDTGFRFTNSQLSQ